MKKLLPYIICVITFTCFGKISLAQLAPKPNIIFIIIDDLNDYIEALDGKIAVETPNLNRISANGTLFTNAEASSPLCCPSRTSFLTGKDAAYTQIYSAANYKCHNFAQNFTAANNNETYFTLPGYFKDSIGYFTYGLNKIFHCYENYQEYDDVTPNACDKSLSWNKMFVYNDSIILKPDVVLEEQGVISNEWSAINDTLEKYMMDYVAVDSTIHFISQIAQGENITCDKPFFITLGIKKPHKPLYIPQKYFMPEYITDFYAEPYNIPFHYPANSYPINGIVMPPQPDIPFADYYNLPVDGMGQEMVKGADERFITWAENVSPLPVINPAFDEELTRDILGWSKRANCVLAYIAAVKYLDAQIGRLLDTLEAYPDIYNNTIIVVAGDNGYSLSEKKHWGKRAMWETDVRVPFMIADLRNPHKQVSNTSVNLLDIFPTLCDLTDSPFPTFLNGSNYLDGISLKPLLENPSLTWERPLLSAVKKESDTEGSCFPQYSIRNNRFHYIRYQSNGGGPLSCDAENSYIEEELYEIGINRDVDPYEWNNLISNPDYNALVAYLQQWLPDSAMYLKKTFTAQINNTNNCFLNYTDTLLLSFNLIDSAGNSIAAPAGYNYVWTNNLTDDTLFAINGAFLISNLSEITFATNDKIIFTLQMQDIASGATVAFDMAYFYIDAANEPDIHFSSISAGTTTNIVDFLIEGSYTNYWWVINGDSVFTNQVPQEIALPAEGTMTITCFAEYGNNACVKSFTVIIYLPVKNYFKDEVLYVIPNPAITHVTMYMKKGFTGTQLNVYSLDGKLVLQKYLGEDAATLYYTFDVSELKNGLYFVSLIGEQNIFSNSIVIMH